MSYLLSASVFEVGMGALENANVRELNFMGIPTSGTKTDEDGQFVLTVTTADSKVQVSHIGYKSQTLTAREFANKSYIELELEDSELEAVEITTPGKGSVSKKDNTLLYVLGAALAATVIYAATRAKAKPVKI